MTTPSSSRPPLPFDEEILEKLRREVAVEGLELCHVDWVPGRSRGRLTFYIDRDGGVNLDHCERASHIIDPILENVPGLANAFALEVSSPGLDRPLWTLNDCLRFLGRRVTVQLRTKVNGTARLKGVLETVQGDEVTVLDEDQRHRYTVRFGDVKIARLIPDF